VVAVQNDLAAPGDIDPSNLANAGTLTHRVSPSVVLTDRDKNFDRPWCMRRRSVARPAVLSRGLRHAGVKHRHFPAGEILLRACWHCKCAASSGSYGRCAQPRVSRPGLLQHRTRSVQMTNRLYLRLDETSGSG